MSYDISRVSKKELYSDVENSHLEANSSSKSQISLFSLVADLSPELAAMLLAVVIGGYTLIGGLGATFYVSYFNTALIFFLIILLMVEVRVKYIGSIRFILFS